jgi:hypothetical protein
LVEPWEGSWLSTGSPADFGKFIADETERWAKVAKFAGAKPDCTGKPGRYSIASDT